MASYNTFLLWVRTEFILLSVPPSRSLITFTSKLLKSFSGILPISTSLGSAAELGSFSVSHFALLTWLRIRWTQYLPAERPTLEDSAYSANGELLLGGDSTSHSPEGAVSCFLLIVVRPHFLRTLLCPLKPVQIPKASPFLLIVE